MSSKKYKHARAPVAAKSKTITMQEKPAGDYSLFITAAFFIIAFIGILNHEMWRDEYQAWLVARDSHSLAELFRHNKYEGHPMLWYLVLYALTSLSTNPFFLQLLNLSFGTAAVFLFCRFSNFTTLQKILFAFGYYVLYEYSLIARYHTLALFLTLLFCTLYKNRGKYSWWMFLILFLLANASLINNVLAIALTGIFASDYVHHHKKEEWNGFGKIQFATGILFVLAGMIISALQVLPEEDNMFKPNISEITNPVWIQALLSRIDNGYLVFRELDSLPKWIAISEVNILKENVSLHLFISLLLVTIASISLMKKPMALLLYWAGTFGLLLIYAITYLTAVRYMGHLFVVLIAALWLAEYFPNHKYTKPFAVRLSGWGQKLKNPFIIFLLGCQVVVAAAFYMKDLDRPFSTSKEAAAFIREQKLDTLPILGTLDFAASTFSALLGKQVFYPEIKKEGSFIIWDSKRKVPHNFGEVIPMIDSLLAKGPKKLLVITNYKISFAEGGNQVLLEHDFLTDSIRIDLLKHFDRSMVDSEAFSVYLVEKVK